MEKTFEVNVEVNYDEESNAAEIAVHANGKATYGELVNIVYTVGRAFHLRRSDWLRVCLAAFAGKGSIMGRVSEERGSYSAKEDKADE